MRYFGRHLDGDTVRCAKPGDEHVRSQGSRGCAFWRREPGRGFRRNRRAITDLRRAVTGQRLGERCDAEICGQRIRGALRPATDDWPIHHQHEIQEALGHAAQTGVGALDRQVLQQARRSDVAARCRMLVFALRLQTGAVLPPIGPSNFPESQLDNVFELCFHCPKSQIYVDGGCSRTIR